MKLIVATFNQNKFKEIKEILSPFYDEILSLKDVGFDIDIEETGSTFFENAFIKAKAGAALINASVLADDSGLVVPSLGGAPGVYSARYAGLEHDDNKNIDLLLNNLQAAASREAYFICAMVVYNPDGTYITAEGRTYGKILTERQGTNGFGYDPVFFSDDLGISFGLATSTQKNEISHRGRALKELLKKL